MKALDRLHTDDDEPPQPSTVETIIHEQPKLNALKNSRLLIWHPPEQILGDPSKGVVTRSSLNRDDAHIAFVSQIVPSKIDEALGDKCWVMEPFNNMCQIGF